MEGISIGQSIVFGVFLVFFAAIGVSYWTSDSEEYHTVFRKAGHVRLVASSFTVVGASEFVIFSTLAFVFGWHAIWFFVGTLVGFSVLAYFSPEIRRNSVEFDRHSIPDFALGEGYRLVGSLLALVSWIFTFALVVMQIIIGGTLIAQITNLPLPVTAAAICVSVSVYLLFGGYKALLNTDVVQCAIMVVVTALFVYWISTALPAETVLLINPQEGVAADIFVFAIGGCFAIAGGPEIWQRVLTAESDNTARSSLVAAGLAMFVWGCGIVYGAAVIRTVLAGLSLVILLILYAMEQLLSWYPLLVLLPGILPFFFAEQRRLEARDATV